MIFFLNGLVKIFTLLRGALNLQLTEFRAGNLKGLIYPRHKESLLGDDKDSSDN